MAEKPMHMALVGCGNIANAYARELADAPATRVDGYMDLDGARAAEMVAAYGGQTYPTLAAVLADDDVELVVNLTVHHAHYDVTRRCLEAGKHVYSEKPLATSYAEARELVELAERQGLRLGCAPMTFLGEGQQTAWKLIREGRLGPVRVAYAEVNWGRIETWHPAPGPFYEVGALFDVGVYPLTVLTTILGPARSVSAYGKVLYPDRVTTAGAPFHITTPDLMVSMVEFASGPVVRLTTSFYVTQKSYQKGIEFHGDDASLYLSHWFPFDARVEVADYNEAPESVPLLREPAASMEWRRAVVDMVHAIREGRPQRATGAQAAHVVEIMEAAMTSAQTHEPVAVTSSFAPPAPMPWAM